MKKCPQCNNEHNKRGKYCSQECYDKKRAVPNILGMRPGRYKLKYCPNCNRPHKREGKFCCQGCHNSYRDVTQKQRDNMQKVSYEYKETPEGIANSKLINNGLHAEDYAIEIPDTKDLSDFEDIIGNYPKGGDW
jgi:hypothetical protein